MTNKKEDRNRQQQKHFSYLNEVIAKTNENECDDVDVEKNSGEKLKTQHNIERDTFY